MSGRGYAEEGINGYVEVVRNGHTIRKESIAGNSLRARCMTCSVSLVGKGDGADAVLERWAVDHVKEAPDGDASETEATQA